MKLKLKHYIADYERRVHFAILGEGNDQGQRVVASPITFSVETDNKPIEDTFSLDIDDARDFLRSVMDVAWEMGVRPTGYENDLGATKHHLNDMRKIVFHNLGIRE